MQKFKPRIPSRQSCIGRGSDVFVRQAKTEIEASKHGSKEVWKHGVAAVLGVAVVRLGREGLDLSWPLS